MELTAFPVTLQVMCLMAVKAFSTVTLNSRSEVISFLESAVLLAG